MKTQAQTIVGIANHGVTAITIIITVIMMSPITMMSKTHIDSIISTILMSLANLDQTRKRFSFFADAVCVTYKNLIKLKHLESVMFKEEKF